MWNITAKAQASSCTSSESSRAPAPHCAQWVRAESKAGGPDGLQLSCLLVVLFTTLICKLMVNQCLPSWACHTVGEFLHRLFRSWVQSPLPRGKKMKRLPHTVIRIEEVNSLVALTQRPSSSVRKLNTKSLCDSKHRLICIWSP